MIAAVLLDFGETMVERISDQYAPLTELEVRPFPETAPTLQALQEAGFLLAVVSNTDTTNDEQMSVVLRKFDLRRYFNAVVTSISTGSRKPGAAIFERALSQLACNPNEGVMVGDDVDADIAGGVALGMATVHVDRSDPAQSTPGATMTVSSLQELPARLAQLNELRRAGGG